MLPAGSIDVAFAIRGYDERVDRDIHWRAHSHPVHELLWNERGATTATIGSRTWTITPTVGLWVPAGTVHSGWAAAGTWYRAAFFGPRSGASLADRPVAVEVTPLLRLLLERLGDAELDERSRAVTETMVLDVLRPSEHELLVHLPDALLLRPIIDAVTADPAAPRTLNEWAVQLGVSPRTVTRAFRAETGSGFSGWVTAVRAQRAAVLLASGLDIEDVAAEVGYRSVSAFGAAFRRVTGWTPGAFRTV